MTGFREGPAGLSGLRCLACALMGARRRGAVWLAAVALLVAGACWLVPQAAFAAEGGSVSLGVSVRADEVAPEDGASGSVSLGVAVRPADLGLENIGDASGGSVLLGVEVKPAAMHRVSFVEYECDDFGNVKLETRRDLPAFTQEVRDGDCAIAPTGLTNGDFWLDGWYVGSPGGTIGERVDDLSSRPITGGTTYYCLWKKGYVVKLDPNNGARADGSAVFDGAVDGAGYVMVPRDVAFEEGGGTGDPDGYAAPEFPAATRVGYRFAGWYWADDTGIKDAYGRAVLKDADGSPVADAGTDDLGYDFFREYGADGGKTLYAKWELGPRVQIDLEGAQTAGGYAKLYCWPGRGYTLTSPAADKEIESGFLINDDTLPEGGLDITASLAITQNPTHQLSTKIFRGWGYEVQTGGALDERELVSCEKAGEDSFAYTLLPLALDYLADDISGWNSLSSPEEDPTAPAGSRRALWSALYDTARISVAAPFRVTFQKEVSVEGGTETRPYTADELEGKLGALPAIYSPKQGFYNRSTAGEGADRVPVSVYVSAIECVDKGAGSLFPCTTDDRRVLGLGETDSFIGALASGAATAIRFGYDDFLGANHATVGQDRSTWIVLPPAEEPAAGAEAVPSRELFFGLDLTKVKLNRGAIAMGGGAGSSSSSSSSSSAAQSSYVETLANVKYTYSVAL